MDKQNNDPKPKEGPGFAELEARAEQMIREGRMPNLGEFLQALVAARDEYVRSLKEEGVIAPDYDQSSLIDELLTASTDLRKPISIGDYEKVRDTLREIMGPGSWRAGVRIARKQDAVVPIRSVQTNLPSASEDEYDLTVGDEGTIVLFTPHTEAGRTFLHEMLLSEPWQWLGKALCVDHRTAPGVIDGALNEGLRIGSSME
jgi:hypothetical protein